MEAAPANPERMKEGPFSMAGWLTPLEYDQPLPYWWGLRLPNGTLTPVAAGQIKLLPPSPFPSCTLGTYIYHFFPAPVTSPYRWRQQDPPKCCYPIITLHGCTTQKTLTWMSTITKTSNCKSNPIFDKAGFWLKIYIDYDNEFCNIRINKASNLETAWLTYIIDNTPVPAQI